MIFFVAICFVKESNIANLGQYVLKLVGIVVGCGFLVSGCGFQVTGCGFWVSDTSCWLLAPSCWFICFWI